MPYLSYRNLTLKSHQNMLKSSKLCLPDLPMKLDLVQLGQVKRIRPGGKNISTTYSQSIACLTPILRKDRER